MSVTLARDETLYNKFIEVNYPGVYSDSSVVNMQDFFFDKRLHAVEDTLYNYVIKPRENEIKKNSTVSLLYNKLWLLIEELRRCTDNLAQMQTCTLIIIKLNEIHEILKDSDDKDKVSILLIFKNAVKRNCDSIFNESQLNAFNNILSILKQQVVSKETLVLVDNLLYDANLEIYPSWE